MNVCFASGSSAFNGGSQNGCVVADAAAVFDVVVAFDDAKLRILLLNFSFDLSVDVVEFEIHSSVFVTSESLGRGTDAYL